MNGHKRRVATGLSYLADLFVIVLAASCTAGCRNGNANDTEQRTNKIGHCRNSHSVGKLPGNALKGFEPKDTARAEREIGRSLEFNRQDDTPYATV